MALSEDESKQISDHIIPKLKNCMVCGDKNWINPDAIHELREFNYGRVRDGGTIVPVVVMTCQKCGYILLFNAVHTGIVTAKGGMLL